MSSVLHPRCNLVGLESDGWRNSFYFSATSIPRSRSRSLTGGALGDEVHSSRAQPRQLNLQNSFEADQVLTSHSPYATTQNNRENIILGIVLLE